VHKANVEGSDADDASCRDTLNSLEYLDAVVHEILRINAPVPSTRRDSTHDATIPLSNPVKGRDGKIIHEITIPKNSAIQMCKFLGGRIWSADD
jgi:hypothetical protein